MQEIKCTKCGNIEVGVQERYENQEIQKLKDSKDVIFDHVVAEDVIYQCICDKCNNYFEIVGERREYGSYTDNGIYKIV